MYRKMSVSLYYTPIIRRKFSNQLLQLEREETTKKKSKWNTKGAEERKWLRTEINLKNKIAETNKPNIWLFHKIQKKKKKKINIYPE